MNTPNVWSEFCNLACAAYCHECTCSECLKLARSLKPFQENWDTRAKTSTPTSASPKAEKVEEGSLKVSEKKEATAEKHN